MNLQRQLRTCLAALPLAGCGSYLLPEAVLVVRPGSASEGAAVHDALARFAAAADLPAEAIRQPSLNLEHDGERPPRHAIVDGPRTHAQGPLREPSAQTMLVLDGAHHLRHHLLEHAWRGRKEAGTRGQQVDLMLRDRILASAPADEAASDATDNVVPLKDPA